MHTAYSFSFLESNKLSANLIQSTLNEWKSDTAWPSWSFSNHDAPRVVSRWGHKGDNPDFAKLLIALLTCLRGTAFLYQGEELVGITTGGAYGHRVGTSLAFAYISPQLVAQGVELQVLTAAGMRRCHVEMDAVYDPANKKLLG